MSNEETARKILAMAIHEIRQGNWRSVENAITAALDAKDEQLDGDVGCDISADDFEVFAKIARERRARREGQR